MLFKKIPRWAFNALKEIGNMDLDSLALGLVGMGVMMFQLGIFLLAGCFPDLYQDQKEYESFGLNKDDLDGPPTSHELRARVINDALRWRLVRQNLELKGKASCDFVKYTENGPVCSGDKEPLNVITFPGDTIDRPDRVVETAYYCPEESIYYYHYEGGVRKRNLWLGPYRVSWNRGEKE